MTLFVGESSPAQGTHFYRADSNLYRATQAAFAAALGESNVPTGVAFLKFFASKGCWLVDLADAPVNNLAAADRKAGGRCGHTAAGRADRGDEAKTRGGDQERHRQAGAAGHRPCGRQEGDVADAALPTPPVAGRLHQRAWLRFAEEDGLARVDLGIPALHETRWIVRAR